MARVALVTGASRNIGREMALRFARDGYSVVVNSRSQGAIDSVCSEIRALGGEAVALAADVRDSAQVNDMVRRAEETVGPIDVLINNAVTRVQRNIVDMSDEEWSVAIDTILTGTFNCTRAVLPRMMERRWGRIISMSGQTGQRGATNRAGVVAGKSGLIGFTKAAALEVAEFGVTVNAISPGVIDTERGEWTARGETRIEDYDRSARASPMHRMGGMSEIAALCMFLCSDDAAFITGQTIAANGGSYM